MCFVSSQASSFEIPCNVKVSSEYPKVWLSNLSPGKLLSPLSIQHLSVHRAEAATAVGRFSWWKLHWALLLLVQGASHDSCLGAVYLQPQLQHCSKRTSFPHFKSGVCVEFFKKTTSRGCSFLKETADLVGVCTLLEWWQRHPSRENTWSVRNRHSECQKVTYNNYYCFVNESQAGVLSDLHGRQKSFLMKDCKILLY